MHIEQVTKQWKNDKQTTATTTTTTTTTTTATNKLVVMDYIRLGIITVAIYYYLERENYITRQNFKTKQTPGSFMEEMRQL